MATLGPGAGNVISANTAGDYNSIQAIAAKVLGTPLDATPTYGYNQTLQSSQVPAGTDYRIYQSEWANLATDLLKAKIHQTGNITAETNALPVPTTTNIISEAFRKNYYDFAQAVLSGANNVDSRQYTISNVGLPSGPTGVAQKANAWNGDIYSTVTLDFASAAGARGFFNSGGLITVAATLTGTFGSLSTAKDNTWSTMFGVMGSVTIGPNSTYADAGSATPGYTITATNKGFFQLTTSPQTVFTLTPPSGAYAANSFKILAYKDGSGRYVYLNIQYNDDALVSGPATTFFGGDEYVDGILTQYIGCRRASGSYVSVNPPGVSYAGDLINVISAPALYGLSASAYYVSEGSSFDVILQTQNVNDGTQLYYTVLNFGNTPNGVVRYTASAAYFTVYSNIAKVTFTIANDLYTDGLSTMTVQLNNGLASVNINVNDNSRTPTGYQQFNYTGTTQTFTVPTGIYTLGLLMVGGGGGGGNYAGGGGGGGRVIQTTVAVYPGQQITVYPGAGGGAGGGGQTTYFGSFTALAGSPGSSGTNNGSTVAGGAGGQSGIGYGGGTVSSSGINAQYKVGGGGGGGNGSSGGNASGDSGGSGGVGTLIQNWYGNNAYYWGGGGNGGSSGGEGSSQSTAYGGGAGGGSGFNGYNGINGGGGGGGGITVGTHAANTSTNAGLTSQTGGSGGSGIVIVGWP